MRAAIIVSCSLLLASCGERPVRDGGDAASLDAGDIAVPDVVRDARTIPTTLTAAGLCTPRSTGRWCEGDAVEICGTRVGEAAPTSVRCGVGERCVMRGERGACEPSGACSEGASRCASAARIARCAAGAWVESPCASRCVGDALGAACVDPGATRALRGALRYTRRLFAADLLAWGETVERPARGFAVRYLRGDAVLARGVSDGDGRFTLDAPDAAMPGDALEAVAAHGAEGRVELMVGDPGLASAEYETYDADTSRGAPWSWRWEAPRDGATLTIPLDGSPGASVFDDLAVGYAALRPRLGSRPRYALAAWVKRGVRWDCGACFSELVPVTVQGQRFDGQLWLTGDASEGWWSPAVTLHELGHWVMGAWGTIPHEGGAHFLGVPTNPGFAWSEGFASWVSSQLRDDPRHYAVAGGTFFWWDIARREIFNGARWPRPNPDAPLLQPVDENEVSAVLWSLGRDGEVGAAPIYTALSTPRMNLAPFARCNTQLFPARDGGVCTSGEHAPHLADMLDALRCGGASARAVGVAMGTYPYPAASPLCEPATRASCGEIPRCATSAPLSLRANGIGDGVVSITLRQAGDLRVPTTVRLALPPGVARVDGPEAWAVSAHTDHSVSVTLRATTARVVTGAVTAEAHAGWAGARGRAEWTGLVPGGTITAPTEGVSSAP